ncbi:MAG: peptidase M23 [Flavobacteriales bacterium]|nr:MAG: peptidase M23 [Flavobacteriales bacterium]
MTKRIIVILSVLLFGFTFGQRQKKEQLKRQNIALKKEIKKINQSLAKTRKKSRLSIAYLKNVEKKIQLREKVYRNTQKEKRLIEDDVYLRQLEINRQNKALKVLRKNYAKVLVNAYKNRGTQNKITFVLSSDNIAQAVRRVQYLRQYSNYQKKKSEEIKKAALLLKKSIQEKKKSMTQKQILLSNQQKELATINVEKKQKERLLEDFKKNEAKLKSQLVQKQKKSKQLEAKIRNIINEEIRLAKIKEAKEKKARLEKERIAKAAAAKEKARIEAENKAKAEELARARKAAEEKARKARELLAKKRAEEKKRAELAKKKEASEREKRRKLIAEREAKKAEEKAREANKKLAEAKARERDLANKKRAEKKRAEEKIKKDFGLAKAKSSKFPSYKGQMSWPVYGNITHRFGRQPHPIYKGIEEDNMGIKIAVKSGAKAKCVFPGQVSSIMDNGDGTRTIVVKHGQYFSIYSNMKTSNVSKNQSVSAGTVLGTVGEDYDGVTTLDFQIWRGTKPINPLPWLK